MDRKGIPWCLVDLIGFFYVISLRSVNTDSFSCVSQYLYFYILCMLVLLCLLKALVRKACKMLTIISNTGNLYNAFLWCWWIFTRFKTFISFLDI